ncbi:MAG: hypothetical protein NTV33_11755 [Coprothermobacterota bacterium]|nr:hypothetical protein [Coprothermobacterota bacterium]
MVGQPYLTPLSWSGARISYQGSSYTLDQAAALGLISNALYAWDGSSYCPLYLPFSSAPAHPRRTGRTGAAHPSSASAAQLC